MSARADAGSSAPRRRFVQRATFGTAAALYALRTPARSPTVALKCAHNIPTLHPSHLRLQEAAEAIHRESGGDVSIELFPDSQLGSETQLLAQVRSGAIDLLPLSGLTLQTLVPVAGINGLAFAFADERSVWAAMDGAVGAAVRAAIEAAGLHAFDRMLDNGFRHVTTATRPIRTPADFRGLKIRVPVSPLRTSMFEALGAAPTSINFAELYVSLQTRLVEAQENPLVVIEIARLYEVQRCCSLTRHMWDGHWLLANGPRWRSLPVDVRSLIAQRIAEATARQRDDIRELNEGLEARLQTAGLMFNAPPVQPFRDALARAGFYETWRHRFPAAAIDALERCCGRLG